MENNCCVEIITAATAVLGIFFLVSHYGRITN